MPWILARLSDDLTDDGAWHGLDRQAASAPPSGRPGDAGATIFFSVGGQQPGNAVVYGSPGQVLIRCGWTDAQGVRLGGAGTRIDIQPVALDQLVTPTQPEQIEEVLSVGPAVQTLGYEPRLLAVGPATRATVRLSSLDATGAAGTPARVAVWYWAR